MTPIEHAARSASVGLGDRRLGAGERGEHARARLRHADGRLAGDDDAEFRRRRLERLVGADRHAQHHAARG